MTHFLETEPTVNAADGNYTTFSEGGIERTGLAY